MRLLLVISLDNTLIGDRNALEQLNRCLQAWRNQVYLVYATDCVYHSAYQLMNQENLLPPDHWITGMGSEVYRKNVLDYVWANYLSDSWNRDMVVTIAQQFPNLQLQPPHAQTPWKASFYSTKPVSVSISDQLHHDLNQSDISAQVILRRCTVDILPQRAGKGEAAVYLRTQLGFQSNSTLMCGATGSDISLFKHAARGVIVQNAQSELLEWYCRYRLPWHYFSHSPYAGGILEAMKHFQFLPGYVHAYNT
jgi:sucrose-6F-phosphate phosphohydrolase